MEQQQEQTSDQKRSARRTEFILTTESMVHNGDMDQNEARHSLMIFNVLLDIERNTEQTAVMVTQMAVQNVEAKAATSASDVERALERVKEEGSQVGEDQADA